MTILFGHGPQRQSEVLNICWQYLTLEGGSHRGFSEHATSQSSCLQEWPALRLLVPLMDLELFLVVVLVFVDGPVIF